MAARNHLSVKTRDELLQKASDSLAFAAGDLNQLQSQVTWSHVEDDDELVAVLELVVMAQTRLNRVIKRNR